MPDFCGRLGSLRHNLCKGGRKLQKPGPALKTIGHAVLSKVLLSQKNGEDELKENSNLGKVSIHHNLWRKIKAENAVDLKLSKKQQVELMRKMWTTEVDLKYYFDRRGAFCI
jgi:hypothetical protein